MYTVSIIMSYLVHLAVILTSISGLAEYLQSAELTNTLVFAGAN